MEFNLKEHRCKHCNKLFFKGELHHCTIEVKCKNCKKFNVIKGIYCQLMEAFNKIEFEKNGDNITVKDLGKVININEVKKECSTCERVSYCNYYKILIKEE